jgi:heme-degrading monooxygenase HmoA
MAWVLIEHEIRDFDMLKQVYLDDEDRRESMGCLRGHIWRAADDPLNVCVLLEWDTLEHARDFAGSFETRQALQWSSARTPTTRITAFEEVLTSEH